MAPETQKQVEEVLKKILSVEVEEIHYHVIKLQPKRYDHEVDVVSVAGNGVPGEKLSMRRGELIPVPETVTGRLDEAIYPQWRMPTDEELLAGKKEKIAAWILRYPYEKVFKDIPKDIYLRLRKRAMEVNGKPLTEKEVEEMLKGRKN